MKNEHVLSEKVDYKIVDTVYNPNFAKHSSMKHADMKKNCKGLLENVTSFCL